MYEQRYQGKRQLVWTAKSTTALCHPFTGAIPTADLAELRPTVLDVAASTSLCDVAIGYQEVDDPSDESNWPATATQLSTNYATSDGVTYEDGFTDVSSITKRYIRLVYLVKNTSGSTVQAAQVAAVVDCR